LNGISVFFLDQIKRKYGVNERLGFAAVGFLSLF
jgi:hypothetical protein